MKLTQSLALALLLAATTFAADPVKKPAAKAPAQPRYTDEISAKVEPTKVLVYKKVGDRELHLHVFEPAGHKSSDKRACFVNIHGGGWTGGEPRRQYAFCDHQAKQGMVGVSLEYRLISKGKTTAVECVHDGRSAIRYLKAHASELGIDPDKIIVSGGSAGGHVAASTALFTGIDDPQDDKSISPVPAALVLLYPVIDTSPQGYGTSKCGKDWKAISPAHQVKPGVPPTIIFHGTGDTVTPFAGAKLFKDEMDKAGNRCELVVKEGGRHGYLIFNQEDYEATLKKTDEFLASVPALK